MSIQCSFPSQSVSPYSHRPEELLLLCYYDPTGISTVPETVAFMQAHSRFSVTVLNLFEHGRNGVALSLSPQINLRKFDGIVVHNTIAYNVDNLRSLDRLLECGLKAFGGAKILMKQDENFRFKELAAAIGDIGFDLIFTCLPPEAVPVVYPEFVVGKPLFSRMLTGFVTPTLRAMPRNEGPRPVDIGYRGSIQPLSFGRLSYEKRKIGDDVARLVKDKDLVTDISNRWEDRLGVGAWFEFLSKCKATLATESGASIFDLDGTLASRCASAARKLGPEREDADYAERYLAELADLEGNVPYNQISPRHFEAAAARTLQIMYPGDYSGIFVAGRHYVELARDYSNIDEVLSIVRDDKRRSEIVDCAHAEIIENPRFWIETFVRRFDRLVSIALSKKGRYAKPAFVVGRSKKNILLICAHKPSLDPRLDWIARGAPSDMHVTQVGVLPLYCEDARATITQGGLVLAEPKATFNPSMLTVWFGKMSNNAAGWAGLSEINFLVSALGLSEAKFLELFGAPRCMTDRIDSFKWYLRHILDTTATLVPQIERMRGYSAIIATDLDALPAALILKGLTGVPVIYDAHEYWPEADVAAFEFEKQFWIGMEKRLMQNVEHRQTVSPGLAVVSQPMYEAIGTLISASAVPLRIYPSKAREDMYVSMTPKLVAIGGAVLKKTMPLGLRIWQRLPPGFKHHFGPPVRRVMRYLSRIVPYLLRRLVHRR